MSDTYASFHGSTDPVFETDEPTPAPPTVDETDDMDEAVNVDDSDEATASPSSSRRKSANRALVRRVANKAQEVLDCEPKVAEIAATLLGCEDSMVGLTVAIMNAEGNLTQPITDLATVAEADLMEMAVRAGALGRPRLRALWGLLMALGADLPARIPSSEAKASIAAAKAVNDMGDSADPTLEAVVELLRKR